MHALKEIYPSDTALANWAAAVGELYRAATAFSAPDERRRVVAQQDFQARLLAICTPSLTDPLAAQAKLCRRIAKHLSELFVFVVDPRVPATNNEAERSLRPLVTGRKISGGTQSEQGTTAQMALASLFGTWRVQDVNPFTTCYALLQSLA
jgi:hypothetical protein